MEEERYSDVDPTEDPFYPETERVHHTTTRSGRKVYAPQRLVVDPYVSNELDGSDEEMSIPEDEEDEDDDSVVLDEEDDGEGSYIPSEGEDESDDSESESDSLEDEEDGLFTPANTPTEGDSSRESNGDYEQHDKHDGDRPHSG